MVGPATARLAAQWLRRAQLSHQGSPIPLPPPNAPARGPPLSPPHPSTGGQVFIHLILATYTEEMRDDRIIGQVLGRQREDKFLAGLETLCQVGAPPRRRSRHLPSRGAPRRRARPDTTAPGRSRSPVSPSSLSAESASVPAPLAAPQERGFDLPVPVYVGRQRAVILCRRAVCLHPIRCSAR